VKLFLKALVASCLIVCAGFVALNFFKHAKANRSLSQPVMAHPAHVFSDKACEESYVSLFEKPRLEIAMVFGYKDARPARFVDDRYEKAIFIDHITKPCESTRSDCGFAVESDSMGLDDIFTKVVVGPTGESKTIRISVTSSSVSPDDEENRKNPLQHWQSLYASRSFFQALKTADIVFYNGHSRSGGGPDFAPPVVDSKGHVKYAWYKSRATNLKAMQNVIRGSRGSRLKVVGLFSCASEQLFTQKIASAKPGLGLISSRQLLYFSDALENSFISLSALLEMKCRDEWSDLFETKTEVSGFWMDPTESRHLRSR
jgi:hypothetical protein